MPDSNASEHGLVHGRDDLHSETGYAGGIVALGETRNSWEELQKKPTPFHIRRWMGMLLACWTLGMGMFLFYSYREDQHLAQELAKTVAATLAEQTMNVRRFVAGHGGVYVPASEDTPPNPYLDIEERDITTPSGRRLTLMNPAYVTRKLFELQKHSGEASGHLSSLKLLNPDNAPDDWERRALESFEKGGETSSEVVEIDGAPHLRFMRVLYVEQVCLECHGKQGYKIGDVRGGLAYSIPLTPFLASTGQHFRQEVTVGLIIWSLGCILIAIALREILRRARLRAAAERALAKSHAEWESTFEAMSDWVTLLDVRERRVLRSNMAGSEILGLDTCDIVGQVCCRLIHGTDEPISGCPVTALLESGEAQRAELYLSDKNRWLSIRADPVYDSQGRIESVVHIARDISEAKFTERDLRESEQRFRIFYEEAPLAYQSLDGDGRIMEANHAWSELLGHRLAEVEGRNIKELLGASSAAAFDETYARLKKTGRLHAIEQEYVHKNGSILWISSEFSAAHDEHGNFERGHCVLSNVTALKEAEKRAREINAELELRVAQRTRQLEASNAELESFAYSVSHDLRGPLRVIDGFTRMVLEDCSGLDGQSRENLVAVLKNTRNMNDLISGMLTLSRLGRRDMMMSKVSVEELTWKVVEELQQQGLAGNTEVLVGTMPGCVADEQLLQHILRNLISNAFKFSRERERPYVEIGAEHSAGETVYFVGDNGIGFDPDDAERVFEAFSRVHSDHRYEGSGIGLAIVARAVSLHGGRLWA